MLVSALLIIAGIIPLFIGLIWVLPIVTIAAGEVFVETFSEPTTKNIEGSQEASGTD
jgi:sorbitol-specific phosphotransferase system component IIC